MLDLPLAPTCPAAEVIRGVARGRAAVVCGVKRRDAERTDGVLERKDEGVVIVEEEDASTIYGFCCGRDAPPPDPKRLVGEALSPTHGRTRIPQSYACCNIWEAEKERAASDTAIDRFERPEPPTAAELGEEKLTTAELNALVGQR